MPGDNKRKSAQLGMPFGTAHNQLCRIVLFDLLKRHGENFCFRCGKEIREVSQLSIEHKKAWQNHDTALFWDVNNIAFSHLSCNISAGEHHPKGPVSHGTHSGYSYAGCRCEACVKAQREYQREFRKR